MYNIFVKTSSVKQMSIVFLAMSFIAIFSLVFVGCGQNNDQVENKKITPVVHGSGGIDDLAYLNAQESFELFVEKGYKYFEVDFIYTSDNVLVCSHKFDHIGNYSFKDRPTYEVFKNSLIAEKYHTMTMPWLVEELNKNKDIKVIFDTKEADKTQVLIDVYNKFKMLGLDTDNQLIAQIYWADAYDKVKNLSVKEFWFTNYKAEYTQKELNSYFDRLNDVTTIILSEENFLQFAEQNIILHKDIGVHYGEKVFDLSLLEKYGIDYLFVNYWTELGDQN